MVEKQRRNLFRVESDFEKIFAQDSGPTLENSSWTISIRHHKVISGDKFLRKAVLDILGIVVGVEIVDVEITLVTFGWFFLLLVAGNLDALCRFANL